MNSEKSMAALVKSLLLCPLYSISIGPGPKRIIPPYLNIEPLIGRFKMQIIKA